jgi:hypothetical protein
VNTLNLLGFLTGKAWTLEVFLCWPSLWSQLLLNELVGSALPILDVISMLLRLGFRTIGLEPASKRQCPIDLDLKSGETTR